MWGLDKLMMIQVDLVVLFFFFSSRRRHTRFDCDWSSDVCSSDLNSDTAYMVSATWDLWTFDIDTLKWQQKPQPLELTCHGLDYDDGIASAAGHFQADLGFEHFFTGHGRLLAPGTSSNSSSSSEHPVEHTFRQWMAAGNNLKEYHAKTRENIQQLFRWVDAIERALPVERTELWSEGEENMEARLDEILAEP